MRATARRNGPRLRVMDDLDDLSLPPARPRPGLKALAISTLRRLGGACLLALGLYLTLALWGYDPADPSFNQATSAAVVNPAGAGGAWLADMLYQFFGYGAFVPVLASLSWGLRMLLDRRLAWPWLPVLALPPAMLATCAFLASRQSAGDGRMAVPRRPRRLRRRLPVPAAGAGPGRHQLCHADRGDRRPAARHRAGPALARIGLARRPGRHRRPLVRRPGRCGRRHGRQQWRPGDGQGLRDWRHRRAEANDNAFPRAPDEDSPPGWRQRLLGLLRRRPAG